MRELLDRIGDTWTLLIVLNLGAGKQRFSELRRRVAGISQRMLTKTLRHLERVMKFYTIFLSLIGVFLLAGDAAAQSQLGARARSAAQSKTRTAAQFPAPSSLSPTRLQL